MNVWESPDFKSYEIWVSGLVMLVGGTLLNGAGLGGGGVFVTVLFTLMHMTAHEAIPNSKMIIFLSSVATFLLNTVRKNKTTLIDFELVRSIVPMSLAGTTLGILINTTVSETVLFILLCCLMCVIVITSVAIAARKIHEYRQSLSQPSLNKPPHTVVGHVELREDLEESTEPPPQEPLEEQVPPGNVNGKKRNMMLISLLGLVIGSGIIFKSESLPGGLRWTFFTVSLCTCVGAWVFFNIVRPEGGRLHHKLSLLFPLVGLVAGTCSGLFGVGGGMIVAPFLLHMKIDPEVAVAVSATCILFIAASTAMQYLFIGRVAVWISLFLSIFGILSSVAGSYAARALTKLTNKPYTIHVIVAGAVIVSASVTLIYTIVAFTTTND